MQTHIGGQCPGELGLVNFPLILNDNISPNVSGEMCFLTPTTGLFRESQDLILSSAPTPDGRHDARLQIKHIHLWTKWPKCVLAKSGHC